MNEITDQDIRDLMTEAGTAGDLGTARMCQEALDGNEAALAVVEVIINEFRCQHD